MELCGLEKADLAVVGNRSQDTPDCGWALSDRGAQTAQVLQQLPEGMHIEFCTDYHKPYVKILANRQHRVGKAHTHHVESMNNKLRCYLARLRRKTHCYSKSAKALMDSLLFVWGRKFGAQLQPPDGRACQRTPGWNQAIEIPI